MADGFEWVDKLGVKKRKRIPIPKDLIGKTFSPPTGSTNPAPTGQATPVTTTVSEETQPAKHPTQFPTFGGGGFGRDFRDLRDDPSIGGRGWGRDGGTGRPLMGDPQPSQPIRNFGGPTLEPTGAGSAGLNPARLELNLNPVDLLIFIAAAFVAVKVL
jgi:hypothetical protein